MMTPQAAARARFPFYPKPVYLSKLRQKTNAKKRTAARRRMQSASRRRNRA